MPNAADWPDHRLPAPLPSIIDLARHAGAASLRGDDIGNQPTERPDNLMGLLYDRDEALRNLLLTFPAQTLGDAVAQLWAAFRVVDEMEHPSPEERRECVIAIKRALVSAIPVVAKAAGLDLAEIGADRIASLAAHEFPAEA